jgi:hypothetical protein
MDLLYRNNLLGNKKERRMRDIRVRRSLDWGLVGRIVFINGISPTI